MCNGGSEICNGQVDRVVMIKQAYPVFSLPGTHLVCDLDMDTTVAACCKELVDGLVATEYPSACWLSHAAKGWWMELWQPKMFLTNWTSE